MNCNTGGIIPSRVLNIYFHLNHMNGTLILVQPSSYGVACLNSLCRWLFFRCFLTRESYDDLQSSVLVFEYMAQKQLRECPGSQVVPAIMNSDVIENLFSSQRGRCNGANTNPTLKVYSKALNTIIMTTGRSNINKYSKKNAATQASVGGAYPYHVMAGKTLRDIDQI